VAVIGTRLVCLDKDGTLVIDEPYNVDPARIRPTPGARRAIRDLADAGFRLAVVSNQPGVALGHFAAEDLSAVGAWLSDFFADAGAQLDGFYVCPHADGCACRKPQPGLVAQALRDHGARSEASWMVGDILDDVEAGNRAGCRTALIENGNETEWLDGPMRHPTLTAPDLATAARRIVEASR
jgi:D-glycero-D-manno-heptose 1,7-bisphosphate phosphatase